MELSWCRDRCGSIRAMLEEGLPDSGAWPSFGWRTLRTHLTVGGKMQTVMVSLMDDNRHGCFVRFEVDSTQTKCGSADDRGSSNE